MGLSPERTVAELKELRELTGDADGAQRVAWTDTWERAREWLRGKAGGTGAEEEIDEAGNQWFTVRGSSERALLLGGHIDSVPNGGWLDGALNVVAGAEVLRRIAEEGEPPVTVRLVNWADEEGARFGRSLFGSSAAAGSMVDQDELRSRRDADGQALPEVLAAHGVDLDRALEARSPRRLDSDEQATRRLGGGRQARSRDSGDRQTYGRGGGLHGGKLRHEARHRYLGGRDLHCAARPAPSGRWEARFHARRGKGRGPAVRRRGGRRRRMGAGLGDRANPLRRGPDCVGRRGRQRSRRAVAPPSERPSTRCRRGFPRGRPHGLALRPEPPRPLAHEARGHEARGSGARRPGTRPPRVEDDRKARRLKGTPGSDPGTSESD